MSKGPLISAVKLEARRLWLVLGWALVLLVVYLSLTPAPLDIPIKAGDKFTHVLAYFVLMTWFANLYRGSAQRLGFALGFFGLGVILEFIQRWTGYRYFEVNDMMASTAGVAIGWLLSPPRVPNYLQLIEKVYQAGTSHKN